MGRVMKTCTSKRHPGQFVRYPAGESCPVCGPRPRNPTAQKAARRAALARDGQCQYVDANGVQCPITEPSLLEAAHIVSLDRGGSFDESNVVMLCHDHHLEFDRTPR